MSQTDHFVRDDVRGFLDYLASLDRPELDQQPLEEARMELVHPPKAPAPVLFIRLAAPKIPNGWQPYLAHFGGNTATSTA